MTRDVQEPTIEDGWDGKRYRHPAFGQISVSRVSGHTVLYGSDFVHRNSVRVRISTSSLSRNFNNDWPHAGNEIIEVEMSEAQWAAFVSSFNIGSGVQCTIRHRDGKGVPGISLRDEANEFRAEMSDKSKEALAALKATAQAVSEAKMSKKDAERILGSIHNAAQQIGVNADFVQECFDRHMEERLNKAKIEINAYMQNVIREAGLNALTGEKNPVISIEGEA